MLKNMKVKKSLILGFGMVIVISVAIIISCLALMMNQRNQYELLLNEDVAANEDILYCRLNAVMAGRNIRDALLIPDSEANAGLMTAAESCLDELAVTLRDLQNEFPYQLDKTLLNEYVKATEAWSSNAPMLIGLYNKYRSTGDAAYIDEAKSFIYTTDTPLQDEMKAAADNLDAYLVQGMTEERDRIEAGILATIIVVIVVMVAATLVVTAFAATLIKSITGPTEQVRSALVGFSQGKLDIAVDFESKNELGDMCNALRESQGILGAVIGDVAYLLGEMARGNFNISSRAEDKYVGELSSMIQSIRGINRQLSNTLSQITRSAEQVSASSDQVSTGAQALAQGATEQASSVEELSATILDISEQVNRTAQNAADAMNQVDDTSGKVGTCNEQMHEMTNAMEEITEKSNEIGKIIKTIEDIAFQTNILALNAAVEAARAGAAGKGFAVVADEVRSLAAKSAEASKNTANLIGGTVDAVNRGTKVVNETAATLEQVVEGTQSVSKLVFSITEDAQREAAALQQVSEGIDQISAVVQTNSATSEQSAAASQELSGQAVIIRDLMGQFELREENDGYDGAFASRSSARDYSTVGFSGADSKY